MNKVNPDKRKNEDGEPSSSKNLKCIGEMELATILTSVDAEANKSKFDDMNRSDEIERTTSKDFDLKSFFLPCDDQEQASEYRTLKNAVLSKNEKGETVSLYTNNEEPQETIDYCDKNKNLCLLLGIKKANTECYYGSTRALSVSSEYGWSNNNFWVDLETKEETPLEPMHNLIVDGTIESKVVHGQKDNNSKYEFNSKYIESNCLGGRFFSRNINIKNDAGVKCVEKGKVFNLPIEYLTDNYKGRKVWAILDRLNIKTDGKAHYCNARLVGCIFKN